MSELWNGLKDLLGGSLSFFYDLAPSYGIAIIFLTIAINVVLFPLTLKQTRATRAFQKIQPDIKRIQKEHKEDPQKQQQELMRVQREAGATPGGCLLPLIVQMPIWIALYQVLLNPLDSIPGGSSLHRLIEDTDPAFLGMKLGHTISQEVGAGLLVGLPYLILLAIMVVSQYVQQWHAQPKTTSGGPQQQAQQMMTRIMPLVFGFISFNFPAGLVLYWTTSNVFRLGQQVLIFRMEGRPQPAPGATAVAEEQPHPSEKRPQAGRRRRRRRK